MITFTAAEKTDAISVMRSLSKYNGADIEMRIENKPFSITFLRSSASGTESQDELDIEFVWRVESSKALNKTYNTLRSSINKDVRISIGTIEFRGRIVDTTKFPPGIDFNEMMNNKFALTFNNIHGSSELKTSKKKNSAYIYIEVPKDIWASLMGAYSPSEAIPSPIKEAEPHVTISYIPEINKDQVDEVRKVLEEVCNSFSVFDVKMEGSAIFGPDNNGFAYVGLIKCPALNEFKTLLDETLNEEFGEEFVSNKYPEYKPHVTIEYLENKEDKPLYQVKPMAWRSPKVLIHYGEDDIFSYDLNASISKQNIIRETESKEAGYALVSELEYMGYYKAASFLRTVIGTIKPHSVADKLRIVASQIDDEELAERCFKVADELPKGTDERIRDAITPFVAPEKLDEAINSVIEKLKDMEESDGEEVDAIGPLAPGTDPHIVTYVKSPQTQLLDSDAPESTKAVEFGKRNF